MANGRVCRGGSWHSSPWIHAVYYASPLSQQGALVQESLLWSVHPTILPEKRGASHPLGNCRVTSRNSLGFLPFPLWTWTRCGASGGVRGAGPRAGASGPLWDVLESGAFSSWRWMHALIRMGLMGWITRLLPWAPLGCWGGKHAWGLSLTSEAQLLGTNPQAVAAFLFLPPLTLLGLFLSR